MFEQFHFTGTQWVCLLFFFLHSNSKLRDAKCEATDLLLLLLTMFTVPNAKSFTS